MIIANVLLVEDNAHLRFGLRMALEGEGYQVIGADCRQAAMTYLDQRCPDAIILDLILPDGDGLDVLRHVKTTRPGVAVVVLSARTAELDRIECLRAGADDYVPKPFSVAELLERLRVRLRQYYKPASVILGDVAIDLTARTIMRGSVVTRMTRREALLFAALRNNAGRPVSRDTLLTQGWRYPQGTHTRTLDFFIGSLRKKIERDPHNPEFLVTVRGLGYQLNLPA